MFQCFAYRFDLLWRAKFQTNNPSTVVSSLYRETADLFDVCNPARLYGKPIILFHPILDLPISCHFFFTSTSLRMEYFSQAIRAKSQKSGNSNLKEISLLTMGSALHV
jgi:hypothetical protein